MIAIPLALYGLAVVILRQENKFTWAPNALHKPFHYNEHFIYWTLIPRAMAYGTGLWVFFLLKGAVCLIMPLAMIVSYDVFNRYFTKVFLLRSVQQNYPPYLEGMLEAHKGEALTDEEVADMTCRAKVLALQGIYRESTGMPTTEPIMRALLRRVGYPPEWIHDAWIESD